MNPWNIDVEELQWIVYLFHASCSMARVLTMTKQELVVPYNASARQGGSGWPSIRKTIQHGDDEVPLVQIDMGYRSLRVLRDLYDRRESDTIQQTTTTQQQPSTSPGLRTQRTSTSWDPERSLIVDLSEIEGGEGPQAVDNAAAELSPHDEA
jgi:hypothetical protein